MNGLGAKLLTKMGWTEGTGLGAKRDGMVEPLGTKQRKDNRGVGAKREPVEDAWWERMMEEAYGKAKEEGDADLFKACEGRRCRPHGSAKLSRIEAHDRKSATGVGATKRKATAGVVKDGIRKAKRKGRRRKRGKPADA